MILNEGVFEWTLSVIKLENNNWIMIGIQSKDNSITSDNSYSNKGCYAWAKNKHVYIDGNYKESDGCDFNQGDTTVLKLDYPSSVLSLHNSRTKCTYSMNIPASKQWQLHINLYGLNDEIQIINSKKI